MLFTELNTDVLLHVYGFLDMTDSINLADTCTRLQDVAQLHYQRFKIFNLADCLHEIAETKRHNRINAKSVLKHIGPFISVLEANLDANVIGQDVSASIRNHCVNVKSLEIIEARLLQQSYKEFTAYSKWLRNLSLKKISLSIRDLYLIDLPETTTLDELHIDCCRDYDHCWVSYDPVADIFERNDNIRSLSIPLYNGFPPDIFEKLKCLERLRLNIKYYECGGHLEKLPANLKMTALEDVEIFSNTRCRRVDDIKEFLQKLGENALHLKCLSIEHPYVEVDANTLSIVQLLNLTSLRLFALHPHLYKEIPKIQPNLKHLALMIYDSLEFVWYKYTMTLTEPMEKIIFLIKNLNNLEILDIWFVNRTDLQSTLKDFLQESVLCRIFDCYSDNRPTVTLRFCLGYRSDYFLQVELDLRARRWTWTPMGLNMIRRSSMPWYYTFDAKNFVLSDIHRFSGTLNDLNSVRDEAIKWVDNVRLTRHKN